MLREIESVIYPLLGKSYEKFEKLRHGKLRSQHDKFNEERRAQKKAARRKDEKADKTKKPPGNAAPAKAGVAPAGIL